MVLVNSEGHVYLATPGGVQTAKGQIASGELLDLSLDLERQLARNLSVPAAA